MQYTKNYSLFILKSQASLNALCFIWQPYSEKIFH